MTPPCACLAARRLLRYSFPWRFPCPVRSSARCATRRKSAARAKNTAPSARVSTTFAWPQTVCTIVRIAGKPATFLLQTPVAAESKSIHMQIDADARLAAAAGGAARYFGDAAGMEDDAIAHLQAAIVSACVKAFEHLAQEHPRSEEHTSELQSRIEVALSHEGEGTPTLGLDSIAGFAASGGE